MPANKKSPIRQCLVTGEQGEKDALIRFVVGPDNHVVPDVAAKLPGRGMWIVCKRAVLEQAVRKQAFCRAARQKVQADDSLVDKVGDLLRLRAVQAVSLARKAGNTVGGFEKIKLALESKLVIALVHALDAGADGIRKLPISEEIPTFYLDRDEMARIMGRENIAHIALIEGPAARQCVKELQRFAGFIEKTSL